MITHDLNVAKHAGRVVRIVDGEIYENWFWEDAAGKWGYKKLIQSGCSRKWGYKKRHLGSWRVWEMHFAVWDPFLTISRVWETFFGIWDPFYHFTLVLCRPFCCFAGLGDAFCHLRPVPDYFAGLRARFCAHRPESTVSNIMFAETKVSMKQRWMRMLTCSGRICSMRTRLHGIAAISILRPALISNIIRNPQVCL